MSISSKSPIGPEPFRPVSPTPSETSTGSLRSASSLHTITVGSSTPSFASRISSLFSIMISAPPTPTGSPSSTRSSSPVMTSTPCIMSTRAGETTGRSLAITSLPSTATTLEEYQLKCSRLFSEPGASLVVPIPLEDVVKVQEEDKAIKQIAKDWERGMIIQIGRDVIPSKASVIASGRTIGNLEEAKAFIREWTSVRLPEDSNRMRVLSSMHQGILSIGQNTASAIFDRQALPGTIEGRYYDGTRPLDTEDFVHTIRMEHVGRLGVTMAQQAIDIPIKMTYDPSTKAFEAEGYIKVGHPDLKRFEEAHERLLNPFSGATEVESLFRTKITIPSIAEGKSKVTIERLS